MGEVEEWWRWKEGWEERWREKKEDRMGERNSRFRYRRWKGRGMRGG